MAVRKDTAPTNDPTPAPPTQLEVPTEPPTDRMVPAPDVTGYHDSVSGRAVDAGGRFLDANEDEGPVEPHRIVADNWPEVNNR